MKDIRDLVTKKLMIFSLDYMPQAYIMRSDFVDHMNKKYKFQRHEIPFDFHLKDTPKVLVFHGGEYKHEGTKIVINKVLFEDRKIVLEIKGSSKVSKKIMEAMARDIRKFDPTNRFKLSDAAYQSDETMCVVHLEIDYLSIFSDKLISFVNKEFAPLLDKKYLEIRPQKMSFDVHFAPDPKYVEENITLVPKALTIEPRLGHPLKRKLFFTESPVDSETHLNLLEKFEKMFSA